MECLLFPVEAAAYVRGELPSEIAKVEGKRLP
jgi:hypothetical protein